jgi:hypothetical protein
MATAEINARTIADLTRGGFDYAEDKEKAKSATRPSDYFPDINEWPNNWMGTKNRTLSPRELILHYVDDEGGPLLSFLDPNDKTDLAHHMAYDASCRKLLKFVTRKTPENQLRVWREVRSYFYPRIVQTNPYSHSGIQCIK